MHEVAERLERLLTLFVLLVLGIALTRGLLDALDWRGVAIGLGLIFVIRPLAGWVALSVRRPGHRDGLTTGERWAIAFFGVRGVGSLYYLAYASKEDSVLAADWLWSTVAFTIVASVLVHGVLSTPVMARLGRKPEPADSTRHDPDVADRAVAQRGQRLLVGRAVVRGPGRLDRLELDEHGQRRLAGFVELLGQRPGQEAATRGLERGPAEGGVRRHPRLVGDLAVLRDPVGRHDFLAAAFLRWSSWPSTSWPSSWPSSRPSSRPSWPGRARGGRPAARRRARG